jgi:hypothetical protein
LIAYSDGLFDSLQPSQIADQLEQLKVAVQESALTLNNDLQQWRQFLVDILPAQKEITA